MASSADFVGRRAETVQISRVLEDALGGHGSVAVISGEPGIGKTRLAEEIVSAAKATGFVTAWSASWERGAAPPFWAWVGPLRAILSKTGVRLEERDKKEVARLIPELGSGPVDDVAGEAGRIETFDAVARSLATAAVASPVLIVLDDIQWADPSSRLLLEYVASHLHGSRVVLVVTVRSTEPGDSEETIGRLARLGLRFELSPLDLDDAVRIAADLAEGEIDALTCRAVAERGGGNPLFVRELTQLALAGHLDADSIGKVPPGVRAVLDRRLARLPQATVQLLSTAGLVGAEFGLEVLSAVFDTERSLLLDRLEPAIDARLCVATDDPPTRFAFAHPLIRAALVESLPLGVRASSHLAIAEAMEGNPGLASGPAEIAHHLAGAASIVGRDRALSYQLAAGRDALERGAFEESMGHFDAALAGVAPSDLETRCRILLDLGEAQRHGGRRRSARSSFAQAADTARRLHDAELFGRAALGLSDPTLEIGLGNTWVDSQALAAMTEALDMLAGTPSALRARLMARTSVALRYWSVDRSKADALGAEAIEVARQTGDAGIITEAVVLRGLHNFDDRAEARAVLSHVTERTSNPMLLIARHMLELQTALGRSDLSGLIVSSHALRDIAVRYPTLRWMAMVQDGLLAHLRGDIASVEQIVTSVFELPREMRGPLAISHAAALLFAVRRDQGRLEEMIPPTREWAEVRTPTPILQAMLAVLLAEAGEDSEPLSILDRLTGDAGLWNDFNAPPALWLLAFVALRVGNEHHARALRAAFAGVSRVGIFIGIPSVIFGVAEHAYGVLAAATGDLHEAERQLSIAVSLADKLSAPLFRARAKADLAAVLCRDESRHEDARRLATEAAAEAERHGADGIARIARDVLTALRSPTSEGPRGRRKGEFTREGDVWLLSFEGRSVRVRDRKGLSDLAVLIERPDREVHVSELVGAVEVPVGSREEVVDRRSIDAYRAHLAELTQIEDDSVALGDGERAARARAERDAIVEQLGADLGIGGRSRAADDWVERARKAVRTRIANVLKHLEVEHPPLARHLRASIKTGTFCSYQPPDPVEWKL